MLCLKGEYNQTDGVQVGGKAREGEEGSSTVKHQSQNNKVTPIHQLLL